jgi:hypothetical protein
VNDHQTTIGGDYEQDVLASPCGKDNKNKYLNLKKIGICERAMKFG